MSFDIIVLKPSDVTVTDLSEVEDVDPLGPSGSVAAIFDSAFSGASSAIHESSSGYAVEFSFSGEPVESAHLSLHYGNSWNEASESQFSALLSQACKKSGWAAFSVDDNSRLD